MTCIVGIKHKGKIFLGGDSAGVAGSSIQLRNDPKVFSVGEMVIGYTTSFRMGQLLQYHLSLPEYPENKNVHEYMVTKFIPAVRNIFSDNGYNLKNSDGGSVGGTFIVGFRGELFGVHSDFQVAIPLNPFTSVGSGEDLALGSLHTTHTINTYSPVERITMALDAASAYNTGVSAPYNFITTKEM